MSVALLKMCTLAANVDLHFFNPDVWIVFLSVNIPRQGAEIVLQTVSLCLVARR